MKNHKDIEIKNVRDFNPDKIFDCGQCFRWERRSDGSWLGVVNTEEQLPAQYTGSDKGRNTKAAGRMGGVSCGRMARISYDPVTETVRIREYFSISESCSDAEFFWRNYFDIERNYEAINGHLVEANPSIAKAVEAGRGIRILRQDPWETVISFIISQNNNIPRIRKCINGLAELFGHPVGPVFYALPSPAELAVARVEDLAPCRLGYRGKYLIEAARQVNADGIPTTAEGLRSLCGVGPKVAGCIDLFGNGNVDSFPIDVWMRRIMNELYGIPDQDTATMEKFAAEHFAPYGGIVQQYLFYYITHR